MEKSGDPLKNLYAETYIPLSVFDMKSKTPELSTGELLLKEVQAGQPNVFTAILNSKEKAYLIIVSLKVIQSKIFVLLLIWNTCGSLRKRFYFRILSMDEAFRS